MAVSRHGGGRRCLRARRHRRRRAERGGGRCRRRVRRLQVQDSGRVGGDGGRHCGGQPVAEHALDALRGQCRHDLRGGGPGVRVLQQTGPQQAEQGLRYAGQVRFAVHDLVEHRRVGGGTVAEDVAAGGREGEDGAEGEDVARRADVLALGLLRGHVAGRADHDPRLGHTVAVHRPGDAEVDDAGAVRGEEDVRRLEVTVDESRRVDLLEGGREPGAQRAHGGLRKRAVRGHDVRQVRAEHV